MGKPIPTYNFKKVPIKIVLLGDVHWGAEECHEEQFIKTLEFIQDNKDTYCILTGDLCEMAGIGQGGSQLLQQKKTPTQQIKEMEDMLRSLAQKGKILGYLRDNHIQRTERETMLDMNDILSNHLKVPYWDVGGIVKITVQGKLYKIAIQHGDDACKNEFLKLDEMMFIYPDCDIYVLAHNHKLSARTVVTMHYDKEGNECGRDHWQIRAGSYLKYAQYARERLYRPAVIGSPIITFGIEGIDVDIRTLSLRHSR
jgi:hypothetical protein